MSGINGLNNAPILRNKCINTFMKQFKSVELCLIFCSKFVLFKFVTEVVIFCSTARTALNVSKLVAKDMKFKVQVFCLVKCTVTVRLWGTSSLSFHSFIFLNGFSSLCFGLGIADLGKLRPAQRPVLRPQQLRQKEAKVTARFIISIPNNTRNTKCRHVV